ncbi:hypothetical protein BDA99DRAFT_587103 [Phascolomyces articulosus]|uniref:Uncharacterized protein n=1 Tax=Phascolomyces articulosus TaxID=60185 RepID=A0AAD5JTT6_9FUNG|nr:hypothetical protein BDA99DRAFT_587103 [Phascolomyces articulosus]
MHCIRRSIKGNTQYQCRLYLALIAIFYFNLLLWNIQGLFEGLRFCSKDQIDQDTKGIPNVMNNNKKYDLPTYLDIVSHPTFLLQYHTMVAQIDHSGDDKKGYLNFLDQIKIRCKYPVTQSNPVFCKFGTPWKVMHITRFRNVWEHISWHFYDHNSMNLLQEV